MSCFRNRDRGIVRDLKKPFIIALFPLVIIVLFHFHTFAQDIGDSFQKKLVNLIQNGGYIISKNNTQFHSYKPDSSFIPASTWKVITALAALEILGEDCRFTTEFYTDKQNNLYIKGLGDPFLISEEIDIVFDQLHHLNLHEINNIYLDESSFDVPNPPAGAANTLNPYDVINGALAVNFNTINFAVTSDGKIQSAENQTPTLPIMLELGKTLPVGTHRINISQKPENVLRHVGELFRALQQQNKIPGSGKIIAQKVPADLHPMYVHQSSKALTDVIEALMLYSNNYITNQLYLSMGARQFGYPATWEKARRALQTYVHKIFPEYDSEITIDEGSGLSRANRITPRALFAVLEKFKPYARLLPLDKGRRIKSGTLKNVYSYAGYFQSNDHYDSFVIILNQPGNHRDTALDLMENIYRKTL